MARGVVAVVSVGRQAHCGRRRQIFSPDQLFKLLSFDGGSNLTPSSIQSNGVIAD